MEELWPGPELFRVRTVFLVSVCVICPENGNVFHGFSDVFLSFCREHGWHMMASPMIK